MRAKKLAKTVEEFVPAIAKPREPFYAGRKEPAFRNGGFGGDVALSLASREKVLMYPLSSERTETAVIDVGSNSVRLVIFRVDGRIILPILNEKTMAGLGRDLARTGRLPPAGVAMALTALKRFRFVLQALGITDIRAVATAAMREAEDGAEFVERVRRDIGIDLQVISGQEEARLSALGVLCGMPEARGIVGDLGGASLELVPLIEAEAGSRHEHHAVPGQGETFPLGPLALMSDKRLYGDKASSHDKAQSIEQKGGWLDVTATRQFITAKLQKSRILAPNGGTFHAVGGGWRALAKLDMAARQYELQVLQHYEIPAERALGLVEQVLRPNRQMSQWIHDHAGKRADTLPLAALALAAVIKHGNFSRVIFSALGLREGLLFDSMPPSIRAMDPMRAGTEAMVAHDARASQFSKILEEWIAPVLAIAPTFVTPERDAVLSSVAAHLADMGTGLHPDHRNETVFSLVLRGPYFGASHAERAFLAAALCRRYGRIREAELAVSRQLLSEAGLQRAEILGASLRLGAEISARSSPILHEVSLTTNPRMLRLHVPEKYRDLCSETILRRLNQLADLVKLSPEIVFFGVD